MIQNEFEDAGSLSFIAFTILFKLENKNFSFKIYIKV